ncbi:MAG: AAA family ATPase [Bryobacterales bacterium]|nr:AAA family ATPase [Bryobacterales bacterium]
MSEQFFGARWWRFDFHTHSPASHDYGKGPQQEALQGRSPRQWLLDFMRSEVDCVAITDHNTGNWIDALKEEQHRLRAERPEGFRELHLFPGVEVTVNGGAHLIAIFDPSRSGDDIVAFLGAAGIRPNPPNPATHCSSLPFLKVARLVVEHDGVPVPAHVDQPNGVLAAYQGETLKRILESDDIIAAEVEDPATLDSGPAGHQRRRWTAVLGSDSHHPAGGDGQRFPGSHFTWVKMGRPSIEGLRLALLDGAKLSVRRSVDYAKDPNSHADLIIRSMSVSDARFAGRSAALEAQFSPWMTSIIGGRGTGKSTLVEMMRLCLRREREVPHELEADISRFAKIPESRSDSGALTAKTRVTLIVEKGGDCYRLNWDKAGRSSAIERRSGDGNWRPSRGDVRSRFPVAIFSQKQILALASDRTALLQLIDGSAIVDGAGIAARRSEIETTFLRLRSQIRELKSRVARDDQVLGDIEDVDRKIEVFEQGDHRRTLVAYRRFTRQRSVIENRRDEISQTVGRIRDLAEQSEPVDVREDDFDKNDPVESSALEWIGEAAHAQSKAAGELRRVATRLEKFNQEWPSGFSKDYLRSADEALSEYDQLRRNLAGVGIEDPNEYSTLIQGRQVLRGKSQQSDQFKLQIQELEHKASEALAETEALRLELSEKRKAFLDKVLNDNQYVRISVIPFGNDPLMQEAGFRWALAREDGRLERDILTQDLSAGILASLYQDLPQDLSEERTRELAHRVRRAKAEILALRDPEAESTQTKWFADHIRGLSPEQLDRIELWQPRDSLWVEYRSPDGSGWSPIQDGSPGQKSAALLAFLLSYGTEPIILDQPEDDLDNHLIYDLIVQQIRESKNARQVIVVTHNPNIVVNGDAEAVITMDYRHGQCAIVEDGTGCLQERGPREEVCRVMEGGLEAFDSRYKRLAVEVLRAR